MGTDTESDLLVGAGGEPTPPVSQAGDQQSSTVNPELEAVLKEVKTLRQEIKGLQSEKDRGAKKLGQRVDVMEERLSRYDELRQSGLTSAQARRELKLDALLAEQDGGSSGDDGQAQPAGNRTAAPGVDINQIIVGFGLDANDAAVVGVLQKHTDSLEAVGELAKLAGAKNNPQTPTPTNAGQMMPSSAGVSVQTGETLDAVTQQLQAELIKPIKNMVEIKKLQKKHAALLPRK
jgi:hypothetical protein